MMGFDNPIHIVFLLLVLLLVFGARRLPEMGRSLGSGMRGFKESLTAEPGQLPPGQAPTGEARPGVRFEAPGSQSTAPGERETASAG
jgi:sec-independent protein translocase protein TatA